MDLSMRQCRAFVTVARVGSFTKAATILNVSQPALTVQIRTLEESLGSRLFDRNSRSVELTRIGRDLLPLLHKTLLDVEAVVQDAREMAGVGAGTVRIAALPSFAASFLPELIQRSRATAPGVNFVVKDVVASAVNALVLSGEVDIGLTGGEVTDPQLEFVQRARDRLCLIFPEDHPVAHRRRVTAKDISELPLVLTAPGTSIRAVVDAAFEKLGRQPNIACEPMYMMTAVAMVRGGLGLTILPGSAREIKAEPGLRSRPIDDASFVRPVALVKKKGRTLPPAATAFLARCALALRESRTHSVQDGTASRR